MWSPTVGGEGGGFYDSVSIVSGEGCFALELARVSERFKHQKVSKFECNLFKLKLVNSRDIPFAPVVLLIMSPYYYYLGTPSKYIFHFILESCWNSFTRVVPGDHD